MAANLRSQRILVSSLLAKKDQRIRDQPELTTPTEDSDETVWRTFFSALESYTYDTEQFSTELDTAIDRYSSAFDAAVQSDPVSFATQNVIDDFDTLLREAHDARLDYMERILRLRSLLRRTFRLHRAHSRPPSRSSSSVQNEEVLHRPVQVDQKTLSSSDEELFPDPPRFADLGQGPQSARLVNPFRRSDRIPSLQTTPIDSTGSTQYKSSQSFHPLVDPNPPPGFPVGLPPRLPVRSRTFLGSQSLRSDKSDSQLSSDSLRAQDLATILRQFQLPPTPLPKFSGNPWEFQQFWTIFSAQIDQQAIPAVQKFTYLQSALSGKALRTISRYQISDANYPLAVNQLKKRFGKTNDIVTNLQRKLSSLSAKGTGISDQRLLYEDIQGITSQLLSHQVFLNNVWLLDSILAKFSEPLQRKLLHLKHKASKKSKEWTLDFLLDSLEEILEEEEAVAFALSPLPNQTSRHHPHDNQSGPGDRLARSNHHHHKIPRGRPDVSIRSSETSVREKKSENCIFCDGPHRVFHCDKYPDSDSRQDRVKIKQLCFNCLGDHKLVDCKSTKKCFHCEQQHHSALCPLSKRQGQNKTTSTSTPQKSQNWKPKAPRTATNHVYVNKSEGIVDKPLLQSNGTTGLLVGTARILNQKSHQLIEVPVLLDTGSALSFISSSLVEELQLQTKSTPDLQVSVFGTQETTAIKGKEAEIQLWDSEGKPHQLSLKVADVLTQDIRVPQLSSTDFDYLRDNQLNPALGFTTTATKPMILIGCNQLWTLLQMDQPALTLPSGLVLVPTSLGYCLTGTSQQTDPYHDPVLHVYHTQVPTEEQSSTPDDTEVWERYWSIDSAGINEFSGSKKDEQKLVDQQVLQQFEDSVEQKDDGYYVRLPWKEDVSDLPDNRSIALSRLHSVVKRLQGDPALLSQYDATFRDQLSKNIIEIVEDETSARGVKHYIAHQPVITPQKETTKLRIVFDASAHYRDSPSLNDALHQGPLILPDLYEMILRFRLGQFALISDVEKAFLQVRLHDIDRDATRCLWIKDASQPVHPNNVICYRFTRVTFGLNASPFLLAATIRYHLNQRSSDLQELNIIDNLYVDNLLQTHSTEEGCYRNYQLTKSLFKEINMNLREFMSNSPKVMDLLPEADRAKNQLQKVLGLQWDTGTDQLISSCVIKQKTTLTKRTVCQAIAEMYDPMGYLVPLMVPLRVFLQQLWVADYKWDTRLPAHLQTEWIQLTAGCDGFSREIPRFLDRLPQEACELITCTDASNKALGAVIYLKSAKGIYILMGKSKLPSLKTVTTTPKNEMNALTIGTRLTASVLQAFAHQKSSSDVNLPIIRATILTDSEIVLSWIRQRPSDNSQGVLVTNRLKELKRIEREVFSNVPLQFGYIETSQNPADCASRGLSKYELEDHIWWTGPDYFRLPCSEWPSTTNLSTLPNDSGAPAQSVPVFSALEHGCSSDRQLFLLERYSSWTKAARVVAYVLRFVERTKERRVGQSKDEDRTSYLTASEIRNAQLLLLRQHQSQLWTEDQLKKVRNLTPVKDSDGIIRCHGRLQNSDLDPVSQRPVLVRQGSTLAKLLVMEAHLAQGLHRDASATMAEVRRLYWIPQLRALVKQVKSHCVPCQKIHKLPYVYPDMGQLPSTRVQRTRPFAHIGLDYFGPLYVSRSDDTSDKVYGCLFTCMTTRLVHIEVVQTMNTTSFLLAIRRFISRRGVPSTITCDNAPTFLLGAQILRDAARWMEDYPDVNQFIASNGILWKHITPFSPWKGGFYERMVQSVKQSLHKAIGKRTVAEEDLVTVLVEIEACLNTRPLTFQEEHFETKPTLRPIDFIQSEMVVDHPHVNVDDTGLTGEYLPAEEAALLRTRIQAEKALHSSQTLVERFWKIWQKDYLTGLREQHVLRMNNKRGSPQLPKVQDVVLLMDANQPRHCWKLGRITQLLPSSPSGPIREVEVRLPSGRSTKRPVNLLVPLELGDDDDTHSDDVQADSSKDQDVTDASRDSQSRYHLRPRRRHIHYNDSGGDDLANILHIVTASPASDNVMPAERDSSSQLSDAIVMPRLSGTFLTLCLIMMLSHVGAQSTLQRTVDLVPSLHCLPDGIRLFSWAHSQVNASSVVDIRLPASTLLHTLRVVAKLKDAFHHRTVPFERDFSLFQSGPLLLRYCFPRQAIHSPPQAEVRCGARYLELPCSSHGTQSTHTLLLDHSRVSYSCAARCGSSSDSSFTLSGILKFNTALDPASTYLEIRHIHIQYADIRLPDFGHWIDVYLSCSYHRVILLALLLLALVATCLIDGQFCRVLLHSGFRRRFHPLTLFPWLSIRRQDKAPTSLTPQWTTSPLPFRTSLHLPLWFLSSYTAFLCAAGHPGGPLQLRNTTNPGTPGGPLQLRNTTNPGTYVRSIQTEELDTLTVEEWNSITQKLIKDTEELKSRMFRLLTDSVDEEHQPPVLVNEKFATQWTTFRTSVDISEEKWTLRRQLHQILKETAPDTEGNGREFRRIWIPTMVIFSQCGFTEESDCARNHVARLQGYKEQLEYHQTEEEDEFWAAEVISSVSSNCVDLESPLNLPISCPFWAGNVIAIV